MGFPVNIEVSSSGGDILIKFDGNPKTVLDIRLILMRFSSDGHLIINLISTSDQNISEKSVLHKIKNRFELIDENYQGLFVITDNSYYRLSTEGYEITHQQNNKLVNDLLDALQTEINLSKQSMLSIKTKIKMFFPLQPVENRSAEASPQRASATNTVRTLFHDSAPRLQDMVEQNDELESVRTLNSSPS